MFYLYIKENEIITIIMAREIFEVLQKELNSKRKTVNEINKVIQEVPTDIGALIKYTSDIRGRLPKFTL